MCLYVCFPLCSDEVHGWALLLPALSEAQHHHPQHPGGPGGQRQVLVTPSALHSSIFSRNKLPLRARNSPCTVLAGTVTDSPSMWVLDPFLALDELQAADRVWNSVTGKISAVEVFPNLTVAMEVYFKLMGISTEVLTPGIPAFQTDDPTAPWTKAGLVIDATSLEESEARLDRVWSNLSGGILSLPMAGNRNEMTFQVPSNTQIILGFHISTGSTFISSVPLSEKNVCGASLSQCDSTAWCSIFLPHKAPLVTSGAPCSSSLYCILHFDTLFQVLNSCKSPIAH